MLNIFLHSDSEMKFEAYFLYQRLKILWGTIRGNHVQIAMYNLINFMKFLFVAVDFFLTLKEAADFVLGNAVKEGNISLTQRAAIERKLTTLLEGKFKNKTQGWFSLVRVWCKATAVNVCLLPCRWKTLSALCEQKMLICKFTNPNIITYNYVLILFNLEGKTALGEGIAGGGRVLLFTS